nr:cysteine-rich KTR domain-containing protein [Streptococcus pyogenes]
MCPVCGNKTRLKIREDTELKKFPLYCPKCRQENLIEIKQFKGFCCKVLNLLSNKVE